MKGIQHIEVSNREAKYKFDLYRNITIVRGKSGTGKTTLFDMISDYTRLSDKSGVNISSTKKCVALVDIDWRNQLNGIRDSIVFIDEGSEYVRTKEFAEIIKKSDNYYVIFNRESLHDLPYSVNEIYEIKTSGRQHSFKPIYKSDNHIYYIGNGTTKGKYDVLLTEDSKSRLQFYENYFKDKSIKCLSSGSNSAIFKWLKENKEEVVFVVADGAAFGSQIDRVLKLKPAAKFDLCLPESFEWLILNSGLIKESEIKDIINNPSGCIESSENFSWEIFFEKYLIEVTKGTHYSYSKSELNEFYKKSQNAKKIINEIYKEDFK